MIQRFAPTAFVLGALLAASIPTAGLAQGHGNRSGGRSNYSRGSEGSNRSSGSSPNYPPRAYSGGQTRAYSSGGSRYSGRSSYVSPRVYSGGSRYYTRGYVAPRGFGRPA